MNYHGRSVVSGLTNCEANNIALGKHKATQIKKTQMVNGDKHIT